MGHAPSSGASSLRFQDSQRAFIAHLSLPHPTDRPYLPLAASLHACSSPCPAELSVDLVVERLFSLDGAILGRFKGLHMLSAA